MGNTCMGECKPRDGIIEANVAGIAFQMVPRNYNAMYDCRFITKYTAFSQTCFPTYFATLFRHLLNAWNII